MGVASNGEIEREREEISNWEEEESRITDLRRS